MTSIEVTIYGMYGRKHNLFVSEDTALFAASGGQGEMGLWVDGTFYPLFCLIGKELAAIEHRVINEACGVIHAAVMDAAAANEVTKQEGARIEALKETARAQMEWASTMSRSSLVSRIERWQDIIATDPLAVEIASEVIAVLADEVRKINGEIELLDLRHIAMQEGYSEDAYGRWVKAIPDTLPEVEDELQSGWNGASADDGLPPAAYVVSKLFDHLDTIERAKLIREFGEMTATISAFADDSDIVDTSMAVLALLVSRGLA